MLPAVGAVARQRQVIVIDPLELEAALKQDAQSFVAPVSGHKFEPTFFNDLYSAPTCSLNSIGYGK